ncbi:MAG: serine/threonine protein kinase, partial [Acidobacteriota bacterium]
MTDDYDRFGSYRVHECIGTGGMATVHRAILELEDGDEVEVALKRLLPQLADDRRLVDDFIREARLASQLVHPNIARILEAGRNGKTYFIAMELVHGSSLVSLLRKTHVQKKQTPIGVVLALAVEMCEALDHAHDRQIVHRDLSPSNLLVGDDGHLKVIDFGVAKALAGQLQTSSGLAKGKLGYMSVEAIGGKQLDARADLFSAGVVMWELLAARRLFRGNNEYEVIVQIQRGDVPAPSRYHPECPVEL